MGQVEQRRDKRYRFQLEASLLRGDRSVSLLTADVSLRGLFLRTDEPLPQRQLVRVTLKLPPDDDLITHQALVVFAVPPGLPGRVPGAGLQLYAAHAHTQQRWESFIRWVETTHPESLERPVTRAPGAPDQVRRRFPRVAKVLVVRTASVGELQQLFTEDVSRGGMFLRTALAVDLGTPLSLFVEHPESGKTFEVDAIVRRRSLAGSDREGLGVEFVGLEGRRREEFAAFAGLDTGPSEEVVQYIPADEPGLT